MKIGNRVSLIVAVTNLLLLGVLYFQFSLILSGDYLAIEEQSIKDDLTRLEYSIDSAGKRLARSTEDWSKWDDTYDFMKTRDKKYFDSVVTYDYVVSLGLQYILFVDKNGKLVKGFNVNHAEEKIEAVDERVVDLLTKKAPFATPTDQSPVRGMIAIDRDLYMVASTTIQDSNISMPSRGAIIFAQKLDDKFFNAISEQLQLKINYHNLISRETRRSNVALLTQIKAEEGSRWIDKSSSDTLSAYTLEFDINRKPVLILDFSRPRVVFQQGLRTRDNFLVILLIGSVVSTLITLRMIQWAVVSRVVKLGQEARTIATNKSISDRVSVAGRDELRELATDVNLMLESLEKTTSDLDHARQIAESANRAKSMFVAKVSHELRTPIHSVVGMLRILFREEKSTAKRSYIRMARDSAYSLLSTINDILDFSKVESGNLTLEKVPFSLREVVREAVRTVGPRAEEKKTIEVLCSVDRSIPDDLVGDPLRFKQSIINLLGNSVKFTPSGYVELRVENIGVDSTTANILIRVKDTGVGIAAERLPHIFDPFTQADESVARVFQGTGLGLTIVKQLIEGMGGNVSVSSEIGVGTEFCLNVPFPRSNSEEWKLPEWPDSKSVAMVDGGSHTIRVIGESFRHWGADVCIFDAGDEQAMTELAASRSKFGMIVVTGEALKRSRVFNLIVETAASGRKTKIVGILSPFEISLRERLFALNIKYILTRPVLADDVLLSAADLLSTEGQGWDESLETIALSSRQLRVLIADDAQTNRIILQSMLEEAGHIVETVSDGAELIFKLDPEKRANPEFQFDVAFTDVQMPVIDGLTATRHIREKEERMKSPRMPIIAVTAHAYTEEKSKMFDCGIDEVITKPIEPSELSRVLVALTGGQANAGERSIPAPIAKKVELKIGAIARKVWEQFSSQGHIETAPNKVTDIVELPVSLGNAEGIESILDIDDVFGRSGESTRRTLLIFRAFLSSFSDVLGRCAEAKSTQDTKALGEAAHTLKGLLLDIGAKQSGELAASLENMCKKGNYDSAYKLITALTNQTLTVARLVEKIVEVASDSGTPKGAPDSQPNI